MKRLLIMAAVLAPFSSQVTCTGNPIYAERRIVVPSGVPEIKDTTDLTTVIGKLWMPSNIKEAHRCIGSVLPQELAFELGSGLTEFTYLTQSNGRLVSLHLPDCDRRDTSELLPGVQEAQVYFVWSGI